MKTFIISLSILIVLCAVVVFGTFVITNNLSEITDCLDALHPEKEFDEKLGDAIEKVDEMWEKNFFLISMAVSHEELDNVKEMILSLKGFFDNGDKAMYAQSYYILKERIEHMQKQLGATLDSIL